MANDTTIEWTDKSWQVTRGCSRASRGCTNCYAETMAKRFAGQDRSGKLLPFHEVINQQGRWNGVLLPLPQNLHEPLTWRTPQQIFVNSMSDLFHPKVPLELIGAVHAVAYLCYAQKKGHIFQMLTKRPQRAAEFYQWWGQFSTEERLDFLFQLRPDIKRRMAKLLANALPDWWAPNIWLGTSIEDQESADARIPHLLTCPIPRLWISAEPLLGPVDLTSYMGGLCPECGSREYWQHEAYEMTCQHCGYDDWSIGLDWVVVGGESGPNARVFELEWARAILRQARYIKEDGGIPPAIFIKQLGARASDAANGVAGAKLELDTTVVPPPTLRLCHPKGSDMAEWPQDLRIRQQPALFDLF